MIIIICAVFYTRFRSTPFNARSRPPAAAAAGVPGARALATPPGRYFSSAVVGRRRPCDTIRFRVRVWIGGGRMGERKGAKLSNQPQTRSRARFPSRFYQARSQNISIRGLLIFGPLYRIFRNILRRSFNRTYLHITAKQLFYQKIFLFLHPHIDITPKFINSRLRLLLVFALWRERLAE